MKKIFICAFSLLMASTTLYSETITHDGEEFTLRDVERKCEVWRWSDNYADLDCRGLRFLNRKCEIFFSNKNQRNASIDCRGSELRVISRKCTVSMNSGRVPEYGTVSC